MDLTTAAKNLLVAWDRGDSIYPRLEELRVALANDPQTVAQQKEIQRLKDIARAAKREVD